MATYVVRFKDGTERSFAGTDARYTNLRGKSGLRIHDGEKIVAEFDRDAIDGWWDTAKVQEPEQPVSTQLPDYDPFERP